MDKCFSEQVKRVLNLDNVGCVVRWDLEALDNPLLKWDVQQAIEIDCEDKETAEAVLKNRLAISLQALEMDVRRINLKVRGEMFLPLSPQLTILFETRLETRRFIDAVFAVAGDYLEPEYWVIPRLSEASDSYVIFVSKLPYASHAEKARRSLSSLQFSDRIHFWLWTGAPGQHEDKIEMFPGLRSYTSCFVRGSDRNAL